MAYEAYDRFLAAVKKFPRWTNTRRRPIDSNGGKILQSIIEEIEEVEDAIIEYKKDFFLVNYIGREEDLLDYIYIAQVGDIEDISTFTLQNPAFDVTAEEAEFIADKSLALCRDGYVFLYETNEDNRLEYTYNGYTYYSDITEQAVWNIFDEFAWWCGLERFSGERNASLLQRCRLQFINHPNSTEEGIRNAIFNAATAKRDLLDTEKLTIPSLEKEEIKFLEPDEKTMALKNEDGITLYEEISQVNRDIARTRKWDLDYWDNAFRSLHYLPHQWDAEVDIYRDGVGYHDALKVTTLKEVSQSSTTNVEIFGYKRSVATIDNYIRNKNLSHNVSLTLTKYDDLLNPIPIQYRIDAEDLVEVTNPKQIYFTFYKQCRAGEYDLDQFVVNAGTATVEPVKELAKNTSYTLTFTPKNNTGEPMKISKCDLVTEGTPVNLLKNDGAFQFQGSSVIDTNVIFHGDKIADFTEPDNVEDMLDIGFALTEPMNPGTVNVSLKDKLLRTPQPLTITVDPESGWQDITSSPIYFTYSGFMYDRNQNQYISASGENKNDSLTLTFPTDTCRDLTLYLEPAENTAGEVTANVTVFVDGIQDDQSVGMLRVNEGATFTFHLKDSLVLQKLDQNLGLTEHEIKIVISRPKRCAYPIIVKNIRRRSYHFSFVLIEGKNSLSFKEKKMTRIPACSANAILQCTIENEQNPYSPVIQSIHIGSIASNIKYKINFTTKNKDSYRLDIQSNCDVALTNESTHITENHYFTRNTYTGYSNAGSDILLDLSSFDVIYNTNPVLKKDNIKGENYYVLHLDKEETQSAIWIQGKGYQANQTVRMSLADCLALKEGEKLYLTGSFDAMIVKGPDGTRQVKIYKSSMPQCDKVQITLPVNTWHACFKTDSARHITETYMSDFDFCYLYNTEAKTYLTYNNTNITAESTQVSIIPAFSPVPADMAMLSYRVNDVIPDQGISVYFTQSNEIRDWSVFVTDPLTIKASALAMEKIAKNASAFVPEIIHTNRTVQLSNVIPLSSIIKDNDLLADIGTYIITPPDNMEIVFRTERNDQKAYPDGAALYIEEDGFNKLKHTNIEEILSIKIDGITYKTKEQISQLLTLMPKEGIICWKEAALQLPGMHHIECITYNYQYPVSLRFKSLDDLYQIVQYPIEAQDLVNIDPYIEIDQKDGSEIIIDMTRFAETPDKISAKCDNPCYHASVVDNKIRISRIAEDNSPVIHNGFYYVDGKEYYFFSHKYPIKKDKWNGLTIENGYIIEDTLYLYKKAVNYLMNSKMECNHLDIHCVVDFKKPRARTNIDPLGHIGACESFAMWEDYNMRRTLSTYKNGYATQFTAQDNGYAILDVTSFLLGHHTISCLFTGQLSFTLAKEIRILEEQALQSIFCEPVQALKTYQNIAYVTNDLFDTDSYRYYLIVTGSGILDEVLIHDATEPQDIAAHHIKAIDTMGLVVQEKNIAASEHTVIEYDPSFMKYNYLETTREGLLRVGATVDWNITKVNSFDLPSCLTTYCLYRSGALTTQKDGATIETRPIEIKYNQSVYRAALKINQVISGNQKGFTLYAYSSKQIDGTYQEIGKAENENLVSFRINKNDRYLKFKIVADENKIITDIDLFCIYKEAMEENLAIYDHNDGSAVTRIFSIGAAGNYRFTRILCDEQYDDYDHIYIRGIQKAPNGECIWGEWKDTQISPTFNNLELFQFKIVMKGKNARLRIRGFEFEVL